MAKVPPSLQPAQSAERTQTGVRIEKQLLKTLKALAAYYDLSLGELLEFMVLESFAGRTPFAPDALARITHLAQIYEVPFDPNQRRSITELHPAGQAVA
jgi:hypothetical protein